jgi:hypothetical protein
VRFLWDVVLALEGLKVKNYFLNVFKKTTGFSKNYFPEFSRIFQKNLKMIFTGFQKPFLVYQKISHLFDKPIHIKINSIAALI